MIPQKPTEKTDNAENTLLFVYGTLRQDVRNKRHPLLQQADYLGKAGVNGTLYEIAGYPGLAIDSQQVAIVMGELYRLPSPRVLARLDEYEECTARFAEPHEYRRIRAKVNLEDGHAIEAWLYRYNRTVQGLQPVPSGDYRRFSRKRS
ncbi:MAG: gamma-glutamylcyclotransferase [Methylomonas sp.]|nr:gamma-glutamylcyclotransferase [Methylomonas sp.]PPD21152.1 MAG: gamma-glutamylcyclotransferase [Methylomonas sp.]PPD27546.1 MAG: gamma-glutamylcyclotransferase [Methylomonas sp.]PPD39542.1 MAG: gamma-glutamylcyclotransferase [Methylomonas sp.]PPD55793.1 MAG: gamma-glutamylcyclotransferase [Methylomonas sp.]